MVNIRSKKATDEKAKYEEYIKNFKEGNTQGEPEKLLTIRETSVLFGLSYDQVRKIVVGNAKEEPEKRFVVKVGKRFMVRPSDFEKILRNFD